MSSTSIPLYCKIALENAMWIISNSELSKALQQTVPHTPIDQAEGDNSNGKLPDVYVDDKPWEEPTLHWGSPPPQARQFHTKQADF